MGMRGVVNAKVSLSLHLILNNGTRIILTEGFPLLMTDDGIGGNSFPVFTFLVNLHVYRS